MRRRPDAPIAQIVRIVPILPVASVVPIARRWILAPPSGRGNFSPLLPGFRFAAPGATFQRLFEALEFGHIPSLPTPPIFQPVFSRLFAATCFSRWDSDGGKFLKPA